MIRSKDADILSKVTSIVSPSSLTVPDLSAIERARLKNATVAHYDFVWRGLRRLGVAPNELTDATQEVFVVLASKIGNVAEGAEKAFLFQTVTRVAANSRRRRTRRSAESGGEDLDLHPDPNPTPESLADMSGQLQLLDTLLAALPAELREVVILCELESMTLSETAAVLDIPQGTVASRLRRARAALSSAISNNRGISEP